MVSIEAPLFVEGNPQEVGKEGEEGEEEEKGEEEREAPGGCCGRDGGGISGWQFTCTSFDSYRVSTLCLSRTRQWSRCVSLFLAPLYTPH